MRKRRCDIIYSDEDIYDDNNGDDGDDDNGDDGKVDNKNNN